MFWLKNHFSNALKEEFSHAVFFWCFQPQYYSQTLVHAHKKYIYFAIAILFTASRVVIVSKTVRF